MKHLIIIEITSANDSRISTVMSKHKRNLNKKTREGFTNNMILGNRRYDSIDNQSNNENIISLAADVSPAGIKDINSYLEQNS